MTDAGVNRASRMAALFGVVLPAALIALVLVLQIVWLPRMPNPAATHWGFSGAPDGFGSPWVGIVSVLFANGVVVGVNAAIMRGSRSGARDRSRGGDTEELAPVPFYLDSRRFLAAFSFGLTVGLQWIAFTAAYRQLDLADARDANMGIETMGIAAGIALATGALAFFAQSRPTDAALRKPRVSAGLDLADGERAVWIGEARPSKGLIWTMLGVMGAMLALGFVVMFEAQGAGWGVLITTVLCSVLIGALLKFSIRISAAGLEARSVWGWPKIIVPAASIQSVSVAHINPLGDFGGWGLRWMPGRTGIVLRDGPGMLITRIDGSVLGITIDDAETAAAALSEAAEQAGRDPHLHSSDEAGDTE